MKPNRKLSLPVIAAVVVVVLIAVAFGAYKALSAPENNPVARGEQLSMTLGCFSCHGPAGTSGIPNAGSKFHNVPSWSAATVNKFVSNDQDIRDWILDGKRKRREEKPGGQPRRAFKRQPHALFMPAYRGRVSTGQLNDLVAYYKAVTEFGQRYNAQQRQGKEVAAAKGCFGCHGPLGMGVAEGDPGSFKGYIPGWAGSDYGDLVKSDAELRQWIMNGRSDRLMTNPVAKHFITGETIKMPPFKDELTPKDYDAIAAYIKGLREQDHHPGS